MSTLLGSCQRKECLFNSKLCASSEIYIGIKLLIRIIGERGANIKAHKGDILMTLFMPLQQFVELIGLLRKLTTDLT